MSALEEEPKVVDLVHRSCGSCDSKNITFKLEEQTIPYGEAGPQQVLLRFFVVVRVCNFCKDEVMDWQGEAVCAAAIKVYKEGLPAAPTVEPLWTPEKMTAAIERAKADCAKGKHWLGLNPDLTKATRCAWDFCSFGKTP